MVSVDKVGLPQVGDSVAEDGGGEVTGLGGFSNAEYNACDMNSLEDASDAGGDIGLVGEAGGGANVAR